MFVADGLYIDTICLIYNELSYKNNLRSTTWSYVTGGDPAGECVAMSAIGLIEDTKYRIRFCFDDKVSTTPSFLLIEWEDKGLLAFFNSEGGVRNLLPNTFEGTRLTFLQNLVDKLKLKYDK